VIYGELVVVPCTQVLYDTFYTQCPIYTVSSQKSKPHDVC